MPYLGTSKPIGFGSAKPSRLTYESTQIDVIGIGAHDESTYLEGGNLSYDAQCFIFKQQQQQYQHSVRKHDDPFNRWLAESDDVSPVQYRLLKACERDGR